MRHLIITLAFVVGAAQAQTPALTPSIRHEVVDSVATQVERIYVDADTAKMIGGRLRERLRAGAYDGITEPLRLAESLTTDLRSINHDLHLRVSFTAPDENGGRRNTSPIAFADRSTHYALGRVDALPGNVGYMEMTGFSGESAARDVIVGALRYLESTDAIILDLRRNRGGDGSFVNFLVSHFTGPDTIASLVVKSRGGRGRTRYTLASVPGPRRPDVPLFVLTSRGTGSAAEDCAFVLQNMRRATIIGDRTAGAGHNVTFVASGHGFQTGISFTRVSDPRTGKEWEQVGVQPDVKVEVATALDVAHSLALDKISAKADADQRRQLAPIIETANARAHVHIIPAARLALFAGEYEGARRVSVVGDKLYYQNVAGALPEQLVALDDSTFALSSQARLVFERDAKGNWRMRVRQPDGAEIVFVKSGAANGEQGTLRPNP